MKFNPIRFGMRWIVPIVIGIIITFWAGMLIDPARINDIFGDWGRRFGYLDFAAERYSRAIHHNALRATSFNSRGVVRYYQGLFDSALEDYNRAIELDPQYALAIKNRALLFLSIGKAEEARQGYDLACKLGKCEDFSRRCLEFKFECDNGDCNSFKTAVVAGLCQAH
jgi:tetratricopeptide (TPR) repeat protein